MYVDPSYLSWMKKKKKGRSPAVWFSFVEWYLLSVKAGLPSIDLAEFSWMKKKTTCRLISICLVILAVSEYDSKRGVAKHSRLLILPILVGWKKKKNPAVSESGVAKHSRMLILPNLVGWKKKKGKMDVPYDFHSFSDTWCDSKRGVAKHSHMLILPILVSN